MPRRSVPLSILALSMVVAGCTSPPAVDDAATTSGPVATITETMTGYPPARWSPARFDPEARPALGPAAVQPEALGGWPCDPAPRRASGNVPDVGGLSGSPLEVARRLAALANDSVVQDADGPEPGRGDEIATADGVIIVNEWEQVVHRVSGALFDLHGDGLSQARSYLEALGLPQGSNLTAYPWTSEDGRYEELTVTLTPGGVWEGFSTNVVIVQQEAMGGAAGPAGSTDVILSHLALYPQDIRFLSHEEILRNWHAYMECKGTPGGPEPSVSGPVVSNRSAAQVLHRTVRQPDTSSCDPGEREETYIDAETGALLARHTQSVVTYSCQPPPSGS